MRLATRERKQAMIGRLLLNALSACVRRFGGGQETLDPEEFTVAFVERVKALLPDAEVESVDRLQLRVAVQENSLMASLENAYDSYQLAPRNKDAIIEHFAQFTLQHMDLAEKGGLDPDEIVPVIKHMDWVRHATEKTGAEKAPVYEEYNEILAICYAQDLPQGMRYLLEADLEDLNLALEDLRPLACENLLRILPPVKRQGSEGRYQISADGDYDASLLLLDAVWDDPALEVEGEIVAVVPARDLLMVLGSKDNEAVLEARAFAREVAQNAPYPISPVLLIRRDGHFHVFME
jgi:uncharacterized protein YtpQ (UPF0354 family)